MKIRQIAREEKIELQMTPMIDIVFQLLVFFIMTFKIVVPEGDFNITMPMASPMEGPPPENILPPMKVELKADASGHLAAVLMNERDMGSIAALHNHIISVIGDERGPGSLAETAEIEFDCDYNLKYEYAAKAFSSVTGYVDPDKKKMIKLVEKIRFSPLKTGQ